MAKKIKLFQVKNILITLKAIVVGIITNIGFWLGWMLTQKFPIAGFLLLSIWGLFSLLFWGYLARKLWKWD